MSVIKEGEIKWKVLHLMCECGGEFTVKVYTKNRELPFTHVCNACSKVEEHAIRYPKTEWEDV